MDSFEVLERRVSFGPPIAGEQWTLYQGRTDDIIPRGVGRDPADWGMACVYRFDRGIPPSFIPRLLELCSEVGAQMTRLGLEAKIRLVPYYEVGSDYLVQAKPPYDGGYTTSRFAEFIAYAECRPPPGFVLSRAELLDFSLDSLPALRQS